jgi:predicted SnoaL-like aldol condensation-catalyzing enzyme
VDEAYDAYLAPGFRHHNAHFPAATDALAMSMKEGAKDHPDKVFGTQRALEDRDLVVVHSRVRFDPEGPGIAAVHIFRFEDGRIAELWNVAEPIPEDTPNANGPF